MVTPIAIFWSDSESSHCHWNVRHFTMSFRAVAAAIQVV